MGLLIIMFSLGGIPPLCGFFSKFYVFLSMLDSGLYSLSFYSVMIACLSAFYYLRIIKVILIEKTSEWFSYLTFCFEGAFISYSILFFILTFFFIAIIIKGSLF